MMRSGGLAFYVLTLAIPTSGMAAETETSHPIVPGYERFFASEEAGSEKAGRLLLSELACLNCHQSKEPLPAKKGPVLDQIGNRARVTYLRKFLKSPQATKPGTTMPDLLSSHPNREEAIEALVHFLASTGTLSSEPPRRQSIGTGRDLYHRVGCVACHGSRDASGNPAIVTKASVPLGVLKDKYTFAGLRAFLENPQHSRPSGRMPKLLNGNEARDVANYLLQGLKVDLSKNKGVTKYSYYEGNWQNLPDFDKLQPKATGFAIGLDLGVALRANNYALKLEGVISLKQDGKYTFTTSSDDGTRLFVNGKKIVENDGTHPPQSRSGSIELKKGIHAITLLFFQGPGGAVLQAKVQGPGVGNRDLADLIAPTREALVKKEQEKSKDPDHLTVQPDLVTKGRELFTSIGCANCHSMKHQGKQLTSALKAPKLEAVKPNGGCLTEKAQNGIPYYPLSTSQQKSLKRALTKKGEASKGPKAVIESTLLSFNCYACHSRDKVGGPVEKLNKLFQTTEPEMGDEARIPPTLNGVGAKLKAQTLKDALDRGANYRPYMHTRMPAFGHANVGHLVDAFAKVDTIGSVGEVDLPQTPGRVKSLGRLLVSEKGYSCFKCHTFAGNKAEGTQGIDMAIMTQRLKRDWFHAYVRDPQRIRPGTRMPSAFDNGVSLLTEYYDGKADPQIEAIWRYLSDGSKAQIPSGLRKNAILLVPKNNAIIYRNFIQGAGPRAIAVGYPERAHLAWDANGLHLALLWQGDFMDAARHWTNRGVGYEKPLGDNVLALHSGAPFAILEKADSPWPNQPPKANGYRFRGYRLSPDDRPTFLYSWKDISFEDFPNAIGGQDPSISRSITIKCDQKVKGLYFRAAVGGQIEKTKKGWYLIDKTWKVKIDSSTEPVIRASKGKKELLVPVELDRGQANITQNFVW